VRALQSPDGGSLRNAAAYTDPNSVSVKLSFKNAYTGNISLYALDWDNQGRRETITVDDGAGAASAPLNASFASGGWATFSVNVKAGGTVTVNATRTAGPSAVLSAVMVGGAGGPPLTDGQQLSQGAWVGSVGTAGYDLAGWDGSGDLTTMPNATVTLVHGGRYQWAANTPDARALSDPAQSYRNAAAYYDPSQIQAQLTFKQAYTGSLHLYGVDWDTAQRRELITVGGQTADLESSFGQGAWVTFPIGVAAGGTVTITVDRTAGDSAVLSGIFLGDTGAPPSAPPPPPTTPPNAGGSSGVVQVQPRSPRASADTTTVTVGGARVAGTVARIPVKCRRAGGAQCKLTFALTITALAKRTKKTTVVLGTTSVTLAGGQSRTVSVWLNATGMRVLARHRILKTRLTITQATGPGKTQLVSKQAIYFKRKRRTAKS
jgi:hypothetical protein